MLRHNATDQVRGSLSQMGVQAEQDSAELQVSEVAVKPARGDALAYDGQTFKIAATARPARHGLTWQMDLVNV